MDTIKKLFRILDKWKGYYLLAALLLIVGMFIRMLEPRVLQLAVDDVLLYGAQEQADAQEGFITSLLQSLLPVAQADNREWLLLCLGLLFVTIALFRSVMMFAAAAITASNSEKAIKRLRDRLFGHIQLLPLSFHSSYTTGELIQRCTGDVDTVRQFVLTQVVDVVRLTAIFIGAFIMMLSIHVEYALYAIMLTPVIGLTAYYFSLKERRVWDEHEKEQDKLSTIVQENLSGIRVVKAFAQEDSEMQKFIRQNKATRSIGMRHVMLHAWFWPFSDVIILLQVAITLLAGAHFTLNGSITVGEFTAFFSYAWLVAWPLRRVGRVVSQMGMSMVAMQRLAQILEVPDEDYAGRHKGEEGLRGEVEFRNVTFSYGKENAPVVKDISFSVKPGETVALVGPTGAGKSTIISLLTRMHEPTSGSILIDGRDSKSYDKEYLRRRIGVVLQKPFLFSTTIYDNIAYARPEAADHEVVDAAQAAQLHNIVQIFPEGYDTVVGEKGVTLSGGQKQRVTLARTLLRETEILVLDDATSAVDFNTEAGIQRALQQRSHKATTFIIAHRLSSVQEADHIIVLDKGSIVDQGSHEELVRKDGFYRLIHSIQLQDEKSIQNEV